MVEAAFEPGDQGGVLVVQLADVVQRVCELGVVELVCPASRFSAPGGCGRCR